MIAIIARVAIAGFAVTGLRSRGRARAAPAADAAVTALDTSSLRRVADDAHSSAVAAPIRRSRRLRFPIENTAPFGSVSTAEPAISHTPRIDDAGGACARRPCLFNDLWGLRAPSDAELLLDGVASLENRAGSLEKRGQIAGITGPFFRRFSGEPSRPCGGSPENRRIRQKNSLENRRSAPRRRHGAHRRRARRPSLSPSAGPAGVRPSRRPEARPGAPGHPRSARRARPRGPRRACRSAFS